MRNPSQFASGKDMEPWMDYLSSWGHLVDKAIAGGKPLYALFIDFEKALIVFPENYSLIDASNLAAVVNP